jgi:hypothetical protein
MVALLVLFIIDIIISFMSYSSHSNFYQTHIVTYGVTRNS